MSHKCLKHQLYLEIVFSRAYFNDIVANRCKDGAPSTLSSTCGFNRGMNQCRFACS